MPFSIGLAELVVLAGAAGLVVLVVAAVVALVARKRKGDNTRLWKWIAIFGLILVVLPLLVVVLAVLWVTPVRVERSYVGVAPTIEQVLVEPMATPGPTSTTPGPALTGTPPGAPSPPNPTPVRDTRPSSLLSIVPDSVLEVFAIPPLIAGLMLLIGAAIVSVVLRRWPDSDTQPQDAAALPFIRGSDRKGGRWGRLRYVFLALALWVALSVFLILDLGLGLAVSLYPTFVAVYAAFWVLVGALLLYGRPLREKALILLPFLLVVFSVRFVDWNSRKPFLRNLYSIKEGMTPTQVEQIMGAYMTGGGRPLDSPETKFDERGEMVTGTVTYRHTNEGWGNSDWGVVTFENGRVVEIDFLPD
jgi:hypothetical protein